MHAVKPVKQRNETVLKYFPLVRATAIKVHKRLPQQVELDDLISAGFMGLIEAIDRFDESRNVPLGSFARQRIHGAIVDSLRAQDWVPRSVRDKVAVLDDARRGLRHHLGRTPTREEMASRLGLSLEEYESMLASSEVKTLVSMDAPSASKSESRLVDFIPANDGPLALSKRWEARQMVVNAMGDLTAREREAVSLHYFHDLSLRETGDILGVSESRACQLCARAVKRLRSRLQPMAA